MEIHTKVHQVLNFMVDYIEAEKPEPGSPFLAEQKVSAELGVSLVTVRRAFEIFRENGIIQKSRGKLAVFTSDYSQKLYRILINRNAPKRTVGIILPDYKEFFPPVIEAIEREALASSCIVNFAMNNTEEVEGIAIDKFLAAKVDGIIITPIRYYSLQNYKRLERSGIPVVMIGRPPASIVCDSVYANDNFSSYDVTEKLFAAGCDAVIEITHSLLDPESFTERQYGFTTALKERKIDAASHLFDLAAPEAAERLNDYVKNFGGTLGILLYDDLMAPKIYEVCRNCGRVVGRDVYIIGYNNSSICEALPVGLSAIDPNKQLLGKYSFRLLFQLMNDSVKNPEFARHYAIRHRILYRESFPEKL